MSAWRKILLLLVVALHSKARSQRAILNFSKRIRVSFDFIFLHGTPHNYPMGIVDLAALCLRRPSCVGFSDYDLLHRNFFRERQENRDKSERLIYPVAGVRLCADGYGWPLSFSRYQVSDSRMTWAAAVRYCEEKSGRLAHITRAEEMAHIGAIRNSTGEPLYVGAERKAGGWRWFGVRDLMKYGAHDAEANHPWMQKSATSPAAGDAVGAVVAADEVTAVSGSEPMLALCECYEITEE